MEHLTAVTGAFLAELLVSLMFLRESRPKGGKRRMYLPFLSFFALHYLYWFMLAVYGASMPYISFFMAAVFSGKLLSVAFCFEGSRARNLFRYLMISLSPFSSALLIQIVLAVFKCELCMFTAPSSDLLYFWLIMTSLRLTVGYALIRLMSTLASHLPSRRFMRNTGLIVAVSMNLMAMAYTPYLESFRRELMFNRSSLFINLVCALAVLLFTLCIAVAKYIYYCEKASQAQRYSEFLQQEIRWQCESFREMERSSGQLHKLRHDISSHITTLQKMTESGPPEQKEYASALMARFAEAGSAVICPNIVLNSILLRTKESCAEKNIDVSFQISVPEQLLINDVDLICVFSNLTSNAVQACERVPEKGRFIKLAIILKSGVLTAFMENSSPKDGENYLYSTAKPDKHLHGWGNKIIKDITEKYDGSYEIKIVQSRAVSKLMMIDKALA